VKKSHSRFKFFKDSIIIFFTFFTFFILAIVMWATVTGDLRIVGLISDIEIFLKSIFISASDDFNDLYIKFMSIVKNYF